MKGGYCWIMLIALIAACTPLAKENVSHDAYKIGGSAPALDSGMAYLYYELMDSAVKDSTAVVNGAFEFNGSVPGPVFSTIRIKDGQKIFGGNVFLENNLLTVKIDTIWGKIKVDGSASQGAWESWATSWDKIHARAGRVYKMLETDTTKATRGIADEMFAELDLAIDSAVEQLVSKYPNEAATPTVIYQRYVVYNHPEKALEFYRRLGEGAKATLAGKQLSREMEIAERSAIGVQPALIIADTSGTDFNVESLRGQFVLVDFWASWCVPCRKENPNLKRAYELYHQKGFEIVGISLDSKKDLWVKAIEKDQLNWIHLSELRGFEGQAVQDFGIKVIPTNFLLDKDGKVIAKNLRGKALEAKLSELL